MSSVDTHTPTPPTMSSREIAELVEKRHDSVKRTVVRLGGRGVITVPPLVETSFEDAAGKRQTTTEYHIGKRDSFVVVAQLSPEFTARLVDRWQELEEAVAKPDVLRIADQARVDIEGMRDLVTSEAKQTRGAIIKNLHDLVANPIAALKAYLNDRFVALHERDTRLIHDVEHLKRRQEAMAAEQHQVLDLAKVAVAPTTIVAADWVNAKGIFALLSVPHSRALSAKVVRSVAAYAIEVDRQGDVRSVPYDRSQLLYRAALVRSWFKDRGRRLIEEHLAKHSNVVNLQARLV